MTVQVFQTKKESRSSSADGYDIGTIYRRSRVAGEVGIEIEMEGNKFPKTAIGNWQYHKDGSLRGKDNAEYVLTKPVMFKDVPNNIKYLWEIITGYGTKLDDSNRTSVHVHLNVQKWHLNRLCSFLVMYFSIEDLLTEWCGDHRIGNLFCLRAKDAPAIITQLKKFMAYGDLYEFKDGMHYAGMNPQALQKFGSLEIRSLRGCTDPQEIIDWVSVLEHIYKLSEEYPDPRKIVDTFSGNGPMNYLYLILGDKINLLMSKLNKTQDEIKDVVYSSIRLAQDLAYSRDWSEYKPKEVGKDPFRRGAKATMDLETAQATIAQIQAHTAADLAQAQTYFSAATPPPGGLTGTAQWVTMHPHTPVHPIPLELDIDDDNDDDEEEFNEEFDEEEGENEF